MKTSSTLSEIVLMSEQVLAVDWNRPEEDKAWYTYFQNKIPNMTQIVVEKLIWNEYNRKHIRKHKVTEQETETVGQRIIYHKKSYSGRYLIVGRSGTRLLAVVIRRIAAKNYLVVTARDASKKERRKVYEIEKK